ncbi:MAG: major capsid protein [Burkholderiaceae bacterium]|nr:major capsid protein [Burkholderiaceae bacterium]
MSNSQARVVDPVLTSVAQGYQNAEFVGSALFPTVTVTQRGGKIIQFNKEDFMLYATGRSPGQNTKRVQFGHAGASYALESHSLEGVLPVETMQEAESVPGIDMASRTINGTQNIIALRLEKQQADTARNAASYSASNKITLSGTSQWSDFSGVSDPVAAVEVGKEAVRKKIGKRANTMVMGAAVFASLKQHPKIVERIKYTGRDVATPELLAALFGLTKLYIGDAVYSDDSGAFYDVWGKDVILAYTETGTLQDQGKPSYGYTYQLEGYAIVEVPYFDRSAKSWVFPVTDEVAPVIAGVDAGYLISNAVA